MRFYCGSNKNVNLLVITMLTELLPKIECRDTIAFVACCPQTNGCPLRKDCTLKNTFTIIPLLLSFMCLLTDVKSERMIKPSQTLKRVS